MFSKKILSAVIAAGIATLAATGAQAATGGTVNFTGTIINDTCSFDVNNSGTNTGTVNMPFSYTNSYSGPDVAGATEDFTIAVSNCDTNIAQIALNFTGTTDSRGATDKVLQTTGTATNVGIRLYDLTGGKTEATGEVKFGGMDNYWANNGATPTTFSYRAKTVQVGDDAPTAGVYNATATFSIAYQ